MSEVVKVLGIVQGPFNPDIDPDVWVLLATVEDEQGNVSVEEIRGGTFSQLYQMRKMVETYGPWDFEMDWIESDD